MEEPCRNLFGPVAFIDVDGTIAPTGARRKQGIGINYKGIWGYSPLLVSLANTKRGAVSGQPAGQRGQPPGAAEWIDKAIELVSPHAERVCLRGDTDFSLTANFDRWAERIDFVFGMDNIAALRSPADAWTSRRGRRLVRTAPTSHDREARAAATQHQAQIVPNAATSTTPQPRRRRRVRLPARKMQAGLPDRGAAQEHQHIRGDQVLFDEIRYFFYVTTYSSTTHTAEDIIELGAQVSATQPEPDDPAEPQQPAQSEQPAHDRTSRRAGTHSPSRTRGEPPSRWSGWPTGGATRRTSSDR